MPDASHCVKRSGDRLSLGEAMLVVVEDLSLIRRTFHGERVDAVEDEPEVARERRGGTAGRPIELWSLHA